MPRLLPGLPHAVGGATGSDHGGGREGVLVLGTDSAGDE